MFLKNAKFGKPKSIENLRLEEPRPSSELNCITFSFIKCKHFAKSYSKFIYIYLEVVHKVMSSLCETLGFQGFEHSLCSVLKITNGQPALLLSVVLFS
jgi:hypothetical protein